METNYSALVFLDIITILDLSSIQLLLVPIATPVPCKVPWEKFSLDVSNAFANPWEDIFTSESLDRDLASYFEILFQY